jgi:protein SCO1/2
LLLLGDSRCGAPCEAALSALAGLYRRIEQTQALQSMQVVMVAPASPGEPPERLAQYLAGFDPRFIGAQGEPRTLQALADDLGVGTAGLASAASAGSIWLIGPDGSLRGEFLPPFDVRLLTAAFMKTRARP